MLYGQFMNNKISDIHFTVTDHIRLHRVSRAQADWTLILPLATSSESAAPLAKKNATARLELLAHIVYFLH
jgi:hypothetical protein